MAKHYRLPIGTIYANFECEVEITFKDLLDFVLANKSTTTFMGYEESTITYMLAQGLKDRALYYEQGIDGKLVGMILAVFDHDREIVFVTENLAMSLDRLKRFAQKLRINYPTYSIEAQRHGQYRKFNTEKLYSKLI